MGCFGGKIDLLIIFFVVYLGLDYGISCGFLIGLIGGFALWEIPSFPGGELF
jgi:hypothetical protein